MLRPVRSGSGSNRFSEPDLATTREALPPPFVPLLSLARKLGARHLHRLCSPRLNLQPSGLSPLAPAKLNTAVMKPTLVVPGPKLHDVDVTDKMSTLTFLYSAALTHPTLRRTASFNCRVGAALHHLVMARGIRLLLPARRQLLCTIASSSCAWLVPAVPEMHPGVSTDQCALIYTAFDPPLTRP